MNSMNFMAASFFLESLFTLRPKSTPVVGPVALSPTCGNSIMPSSSFSTAVPLVSSFGSTAETCQEPVGKKADLRA